MLWLILTLLALTTLAGGLVLIRGWRGVAVDDHPLCRQCGFDLTGKPPDSTRCAECGADLLLKRAVRIGHRRRRPVVALVGLLLLAVPAGAGGTFLWPILTASDPNAAKPLWWLLTEARVTASSRDAVGAELLRRIARGQISNDQVKSTVATLVRIQADESTAWSRRFGDVIETAYRRGLVTHGQYRSYVRHILGSSPRLIVRPRVASGDMLPVRLTFSPVRGSSSGNIPAIVDSWLRIDGRDLYHTAELHVAASSVTAARIFNMDYEQRFPVAAETMRLLEAGKHTATAVVTIRPRLRPGGAGNPDHEEADLTIAATFNVLPPGEPSVTLHGDRSLQDAIRDAIQVKSVVFHQLPNRAYAIEVDVNPIPVSIAMQVFADTTTGNRVALGAICVAGNQPRTRRSVRGVCRERIAVRQQSVANPALLESVVTAGGALMTKPVVRLILRPDPSAAVTTTDILDMWDGEIVLDDVPVR
jgi:hypothetical protein